MTNQELIDAMKVKQEEFWDWQFRGNDRSKKEEEEEEEKKETFSIGDIIWIAEEDQHYLLASVGQDKIIQACLTEPRRGNRWNNITSVKDMRAITWGELNKSIKDDFGLVEPR